MSLHLKAFVSLDDLNGLEVTGSGDREDTAMFPVKHGRSSSSTDQFLLECQRSWSLKVLPPCPLFSLLSRWTTVLQLFSTLGGRRFHRGTCLHTEQTVNKRPGEGGGGSLMFTATTLTLFPVLRCKRSLGR